jgi:hypothetical protein
VKLHGFFRLDGGYRRIEGGMHHSTLSIVLGSEAVVHSFSRKNRKYCCGFPRGGMFCHHLEGAAATRAVAICS